MNLSEAEMELWIILYRLSAFFNRGEVARVAQPSNEPVSKAENGSQKIDERDRSMKLEDLNVEDWPFEDSYLRLFRLNTK